MDADSEHIWRYLDLAKFISMLAKEALYFACPLEWEDPFEGYLPRKYIEAHQRTLQRIIDQKFIKLGQPLTPESEKLREIENTVENLNKRMPFIYSNLPIGWGVTCWHKSEYESEAMWKLYSMYGQGIAIESTIEKLKSSMPQATKMTVDSVKYVDFDRTEPKKGPLNNPLLFKRKSYEHEKEIRALIPLTERGKGIFVNCNLNVLIKTIHISPFAPPWWIDLIDYLCRTANTKVTQPIKQSDLMKRPNYSLNLIVPQTR